MKYIKLFEELDQEAHTRLIKMGLIRSTKEYLAELMADRVGANIPPDILNGFAKDKQPAVRQAAAENQNTSTKVLGRLARDSNRYVRWSVAENPKTSVETLDRLIGDKSPDIRRAATDNLNSRTKSNEAP
jgi:hypothetical protein